MLDMFEQEGLKKISFSFENNERFLTLVRATCYKDEDVSIILSFFVTCKVFNN